MSVSEKRLLVCAALGLLIHGPFGTLFAVAVCLLLVATLEGELR
jgi:hypothetical protein